MAITTVNARYEGFIFDGQNSRNYGVYVTDVEVFGAPVRNVEMIQIPGRNGAYALDNGFYENIQVTYKCAMGCESQADFNAGISAFRNMLASRIGYKRLEDEINADEYRMACFHGGISVPTLNKDTATFDVVFDCKPQRFLKSGETAVTIGGDVTNPQTKSGSIVSIESDGGDKVTSLVAQITPVQAGSGDPSPTNVRAITGWTEAKVFDTGKNLVDESTAIGFNAAVTVDGGYISVTKNASSNYPAAHINTYLRAGVTYTVSATCVQATAQAKLAIRDIAPSSTTVTSSASYSEDGQRKSVTYTPTKSGMYRVALFSCFGTADTGTAIFTDVQCEIGSTATAYEPYTGTITTTVLGRTVYGGTVDIVTGTLTVTHKAETFDGTESWGSEQTSGGLTNYYLNLDNASKMTGRQGGLLDDEMMCNWLAPSSSITTYAVYVGTTSKYLNCKCSSASDVTAFKSMLTATPLVVVYPLATPQTYNLTTHEVELLAGRNNVWADTGDISITYGHDPNKLVNPTLYDAHPLLSFTGSGTININSDTIAVTNQPIGDIILANVTKLASGESVTWSDTGRYLTGDAIRIDSIPAITTTVILDTYSYANYTQYSGDDMDYLSTTATARGTMTQHSIPNPPQFVAGTARSVSYSGTVTNKVKNKSSGTIVDCTINLTVTIAYDGAHSITATTNVTTSLGTASTTVTIDTVTVNSTKSSLTGTAFIDLDIGEAYSIDGGAVVSINDSVSLGASLPVLKPSTNTISKTGSVANLTIVPRWWEL